MVWLPFREWLRRKRERERRASFFFQNHRYTGSAVDSILRTRYSRPPPSPYNNFRSGYSRSHVTRRMDGIYYYPRRVNNLDYQDYMGQLTGQPLYTYSYSPVSHARRLVSRRAHLAARAASGAVPSWSDLRAPLSSRDTPFPVRDPNAGSSRDLVPYNPPRRGIRRARDSDLPLTIPDSDDVVVEAPYRDYASTASQFASSALSYAPSALGLLAAAGGSSLIGLNALAMSNNFLPYYEGPGSDLIGNGLTSAVNAGLAAAGAYRNVRRRFRRPGSGYLPPPEGMV